MRRLAVGFDGVPHGHLFVREGRICAEGPNLNALMHHAEAAGTDLVHRGDESKLTPEGILQHLSETLQGRAHAEWEGDDEPVWRVEKGFDESAVSREKSEHDGKRPGEFAPKGTAGDGERTPAAPKKKAAPKLTDEQRDALRELANLFPDGLPAGLLDAKGRIDRDAAFPEEKATKGRIEKMREKWDATHAKIESLSEANDKLTERADADVAVKDRIDDELCGDDTSLAADNFLDYGTDHATFDAIEAVVNAVEELAVGSNPEFEDAPDLSDYLEEDFPDEDDDPDTLDDQEDSAKDAVKAVADRLGDAEHDLKAHEKDVTKTSGEWRAATRKLVEGVRDAAESALAIPAEKYHAASKEFEQDPDEYTPDDIDDTLDRVKLLRDRSKAILAEMK